MTSLSPKGVTSKCHDPGHIGLQYVNLEETQTFSPLQGELVCYAAKAS